MPPYEITALMPCSVIYVGLLIKLNKELDDEGVSWPELLLTICIPVLGLLISFNNMQKAVKAVRKKYGSVI